MSFRVNNPLDREREFSLSSSSSVKKPLQLHLKKQTVMDSKTHLHKAKSKAKWCPFLMNSMRCSCWSGGEDKKKFSLSHSISVNASLGLAHKHAAKLKIVLHWDHWSLLAISHSHLLRVNESFRVHSHQGQSETFLWCLSFFHLSILLSFSLSLGLNRQFRLAMQDKIFLACH